MTNRESIRTFAFAPTAILVAVALVWLFSTIHSISAIAENLNVDDAIGNELMQVVHKQSEAWNRGDLVEFMAPYWNDERLTFSSSGKTNCWKT